MLKVNFQFLLGKTGAVRTHFEFPEGLNWTNSLSAVTWWKLQNIVTTHTTQDLERAKYLFQQLGHHHQ